MAKKKSAKKKPAKKTLAKKTVAKKKPAKKASTSVAKKTSVGKKANKKVAKKAVAKKQVVKKKVAKKAVTGKKAAEAPTSSPEPVASSAGSMNLPADLLAFLNAGTQLQYDAAACEIGQVTLLSADQLRVRIYPTDADNGPFEGMGDPHEDEYGCYLVPGVSLFAGCDGYEPDGLLLWFPDEQRYGTWDSSHQLIEVFRPAVTWTDLAKDPVTYINAFWGDGEDEGRPGGLKPLVPWPKYQYSPKQRCWSCNADGSED